MFNRYFYDSLFRGQSGPYRRDRLPDAQLPGEAVNADARTPASPCDEAAKGAVTLAGDAVDYSNGNLPEYEYDFTSNGEMPLCLQRSYASQGNYRGIFGLNWMSNFDLTLVKSGSQVVLVRSDRTRIRFSPRQQPTPGWYVGFSSARVLNDGAGGYIHYAANFAFHRKVFHSRIFQEMNLGFPGQYFDKETGFWHNGFRDYDSRTGRYLQPDSIGLAGGLNTYAYVLERAGSKV